MAVQILVTIALVLGVANARYVSPYDAGPHAEPLHGYSSADPDYDPNPQYSFSYSVQEPITGDFKDHQETRNGDSVQGRYTMLEADGSRRIVDYTASPGVGFNAVVSKEGGNAGYASQHNGAPTFAATRSGVSHGSRFIPISPFIQQ